MRTLDAVKRGLDAMISDERDAVTGRFTERGLMLNRVREQYLKELDALNPDYAAARGSWAGPSQSLDAIRAGRTLFQRSPAEIKQEFDTLSQGDKEFFRLGVADSLRERISKTPFNADEARTILRNDWMKQQLKPLFRTDADYNKFIDSVMDEQAMRRTRNEMVAGSQTAERGMEDIYGGTENALMGGKIAYSAATGKWLSMLHNAWRVLHDLGRKPDPVLNEHIAKMLTQTPIPGQMAQRLTGQVVPKLTEAKATKAAKAIQESYPYLIPSMAGTAATEQ